MRKRVGMKVFSIYVQNFWKFRGTFRKLEEKNMKVFIYWTAKIWENIGCKHCRHHRVGFLKQKKNKRRYTDRRTNGRKVWKFGVLLKRTRSSRGVNKTVTQERMDEDEYRRVTGIILNPVRYANDDDDGIRNHTSQSETAYGYAEI